METIEQAVESYLGQHKGRSQKTERTYRVALGHFGRYLEERGIGPDDSPTLLTRAVALEFLPWLADVRWQRSQKAQPQPLAMRTRNLYVRAVMGLYKYLALMNATDLKLSDYEALSKEMGKKTEFEPDPIEVRLPKDVYVNAVLDVARQRPELPDDEVEARRTTLGWMRDLTIVLCLHSSGARVGELAALVRRNLDHEEHGAWVHGKGNRKRFVYFSREAWKALDAYLRERGMGYGPDDPLFCRHDRRVGDRVAALSTRSIERLVQRLANRAGVLEEFHMTPHSFRHSFATRLLHATDNLALTQDALGHADPGTTRIYAQTTREELMEAHNKIFNE